MVIKNLEKKNYSCSFVWIKYSLKYSMYFSLLRTDNCKFSLMGSPCNGLVDMDSHHCWCAISGKSVLRNTVYSAHQRAGRNLLVEGCGPPGTAHHDYNTVTMYGSVSCKLCKHLVHFFVTILFLYLDRTIECQPRITHHPPRLSSDALNAKMNSQTLILYRFICWTVSIRCQR